MDHSGARLQIREWTPVLAMSALRARQAQRGDVAGVGLVLFREATTSWRWGSTARTWVPRWSDGWVDRGRIVCPWHGSRFARGSGKVLRGPATAPLPCYQARILEGMIELRGGTPGAAGVATGVVRPRSASSAGLVGVLKQQMPCQVGRIGVAKT